MVCRFCNATFGENDPRPCGGWDGCLARFAPDPHELKREMLDAHAREVEMSERLFGNRRDARYIDEAP